VGVGLGAGEVEDLLVPAADGESSAGLHDPLGMRAGHVAVLVDHLWLEPQPELHPELGDPVDER
jgi:hypothetical protein